MIKAAPLLLQVLAAAGCHTHAVTQTQAHRATLADNNQDFDRYVTQRSERLYQSGAFKNRSDADAKARSEAEILYGEKTPDYSASWTWGSGEKSLKLADYDKMIQDAKTR